MLVVTGLVRGLSNRLPARHAGSAKDAASMTSPMLKARGAFRDIIDFESFMILPLTRL